MTKTNKTRSALFTSIISLLLCVSMLVGTTFAWFTDEVKSGTNVIAAGNLDVELYYQVEGQTDWTKVTATSNIFMENALWEPGHTEVVKLKVVNEGTLALKYQLGVNVAGETGSINVEGDPFKLSDHIKFGIVEGDQNYDTREDAVAAVEETATALKTAFGTKVIKLLPKTETNSDNEDIVTMVVYMPETVGNEANYAKGADVPTINLGLNVFATQVEAEDDSFGNDYDEGIWNDAFQVYSVEDLQTAINAGETNIVLMGDILITDETALDTTTPLPTAIVINNGNPVTLDLNGHSIVMEAKGTEQTALLFVHNTNVTIKGEGVLEQQGLDNSYTIWAKGASTVTIESGKFVSNTADKKGIMLYASGNTAYDSTDDYATINVRGGEFISTSTGSLQYYANVMNHGVGKINYYGGIFNWDPANDVSADDVDHIKVADGYHAVESNGLYYVVPEDVDNVITSAAELQAALDAATGDALLVLAADITGDVFVTQREGVNIIIDGNNLKYDGTIEIRGQSRNTGAETLTIKNINFVTDKDLYFVECNSTESAKRYAHNVTIESCTFTNEGNGTVVPARFRQCYNITMKDCTVDGTFSPLWATGCTGITIDNVTANCTDEGITVGPSNNVVLNKCNFTVTGENGFGVRADASGAYTLTITECTFDAKTNVILRNATSADYVAIVGTKYLATPASVQKLIDAGQKQIILTAGEYKNTIVMKDGVTLEGTKGAVVDCINLNGASNVTLKGITFDAAGAAYGYNGKGKAIQPANIISRGSGSNVAGAANIVIEDCTFGGTFVDGGVAIAFTDQGTTGYSNIAIKGCTFEATGGYTDIYTYYSGNNGSFAIEGNTFASKYAMDVSNMLPIYLGYYQSGKPVVIKDNDFQTKATIEAAVFLQDHSSYGVSYDASGNTFAN